ncbi:MAG: hypothetical protein Q4B54_06810 [Coriobacteriales bacterium]|nr:hypothetical protein [Coriobacteriales bacterium]
MLPTFVGVVACALVTLFAMSALEPVLLAHAHEWPWMPSYDAWTASLAAGDPLATVLWLLGDVTDVCFLRSVPATVPLLGLSLLAAHLENVRSPHAGTGVEGNGRIYGRMLLTAFASMLVARLAYANQYATGWAPTLVPFIVAQALVIHFEATAATCVTAAVWAGLTSMPVAVWAYEYLAIPLGLPSFPALAVGMISSYVLGTELFFRLPFTTRRRPAAPGEEPAVPVPTSPGRALVRRVLADAPDLIFSGSDLGGIGLVVGLLLGWLANPNHGVYASGRTGLVLCCFVLVSALSIFAYWPTFKRDGYVYSLVGLLPVGSIALAYDATPLVLIPTVVVSALACPALVFLLKSVTPRLSNRWPSAFYVQIVGVIVTLALSLYAKMLIP